MREQWTCTALTSVDFAAFVGPPESCYESFQPRVRVIARVYARSDVRRRLRRLRRLFLQIRGPSTARQFGASGGTQHRIGSVCRYVRQFRLQIRGPSAPRSISASGGIPQRRTGTEPQRACGIAYAGTYC